MSLLTELWVSSVESRHVLNHLFPCFVSVVKLTLETAGIAGTHELLFLHLEGDFRVFAL